MNGQPLQPFDTGIAEPPVMAEPVPELVPILVVDDQASNLEAMEVLLAPTGCQLVRAH